MRKRLFGVVDRFFQPRKIYRGLETIQELLQLLSIRYPTFENQNHYVHLTSGNDLAITMNIGDEFHMFILNEIDFGRTAIELEKDLSEMLSIRLKEYKL